MRNYLNKIYQQAANIQLQRLVCLLLLLEYSSSSLWALELISPPQNTVVHPGDTVTIKVVPSLGERIGRVYFDGLFGTKVDAPPYEYKYVVGPQDIGNIKIDIFAMKPESDGPFASPDAQFSSEVVLKLISTLPSTVTLQSIQASPKLMFLYKLPEGSDPDDVRFAEMKSLSVSGLYSDGVKREITSSASGTTYTSNDEKIVKVDSEGKATAIVPGRAKITIKNGDKQLAVDVVVKQKR